MAKTQGHTAVNRLYAGYLKALRIIIYAFVIASGVGVFVMILTTCADVLLRRFGYPIVGAYDIVKIAGALTLALAMPYTTAVKGHVAIEYFFHKLNRNMRIVVDSILRIISMVLFAFLGWRSILYGNEFLHNNQVTQTLQLPIFWVPYVMSACCIVVILVIGYNLIHPGREMIKP